MAEYLLESRKRGGHDRFAEVDAGHQGSTGGGVAVRIHDDISGEVPRPQFLEGYEPQLEPYRIGDPKSGDGFSYFPQVFLTAVADDREPGLNTASTHALPGLQQEGHALVRIQDALEQHEAFIGR